MMLLLFFFAHRDVVIAFKTYKPFDMVAWESLATIIWVGKMYFKLIYGNGVKIYKHDYLIFKLG